jgi:hypothetical protein
MGDAAATVFALWAMHTCALEAFDTVAYLNVTAPTKRAGKSRLAVEVGELLVREPLPGANLSDAAMFRVIEESCPTLLLDELDAGVLAKREDMAKLLNAGWRRGAGLPLRRRRLRPEGGAVRDLLREGVRRHRPAARSARRPLLDHPA